MRRGESNPGRSGGYRSLMVRDTPERLPVLRPAPSSSTRQRPRIWGPRHARVIDVSRPMPAVVDATPPRGTERLVEPARGALVTVRTLVLLGIIVALVGTFATLRVVDPALFAPNRAPTVVPAVREWRGGSGSFEITGGSRIVVDGTSAAQLLPTAQVFASDLAAVTGRKLPVLTTNSERVGDFFLTLQSSDAGLGDEGYTFDIGDIAVISAHSVAGVAYGTRTALQILLQDSTRLQMLKGTVRDYPQYRERGFMLDAGRKFFPLQDLEAYVEMMSWYKMNDFHLHLNDNVFGGDDGPGWRTAYAAFRLNSPRFPGLAAKDGSYTQQDMRALQDFAEARGVTITPEIDAPAHALALTQYRPDLASPNLEKDFLDLGNPATYTFMEQIWGEFAPWFDSKQVSIGADEYAQGDANQYRTFINRMDDFLRQQGKTVRMWGSLSEMPGSVKVNDDIITEAWDNSWSNPVDTASQGPIINANDGLLYIVPKAGYFHEYLDTQLLYDRWEPYIFDLSNPGLNLRPDDPHLLGGMFAVWNDMLGTVVSDPDVTVRIRPAMQTLGQKMWSNQPEGMSYDQFQALVNRIGDPPGTDLPGKPAGPGAPSGAVPSRAGAADLDASPVADLPRSA
jgi:hexosaminidase